MSERTMRTKLVNALKPLDAMAVENPCLPGTPDVNYIEGWIELKWLPKWPKRDVTKVRIPHYTKQQRVWHFKRRRAGGQSWLLLQVRREWLLFDGAVAALVLGHATKKELISAAEAYWNAGLPAQDLVDLLSEEQPPFTFDPADYEGFREQP
jgi:hypothetical protein